MKMNFFVHTFMFTALTLSLASEAMTNPVPTEAVTATEALDREMMLRSKVEFAVATIRSSADLDAYVSLHGADSYVNTPLAPLSPMSRQRLLASVVFGESGIGSIYYGDMRAELSPTEAYAILALFGAQRLAPIVSAANVMTDADVAIQSMRRPPDHEDKYCAKRATCRSESFAVCTSSC